MKTIILAAGAALVLIVCSLQADARIRYRADPGEYRYAPSTAPVYRGGSRSYDPDPFIRGQIQRDIPEKYHF